MPDRTEVKTEIDDLPNSPEYLAVAQLADLEALGATDLATLRSDTEACKVGLFESSPDRNGVERALRERPQPEGCPLHVDGAQQCINAAEEALEQARGKVRSALVGMANLLRQPALRSLLEQGEKETSIAEVLKAPDAEKLADLLAERIPSEPADARLLAKYLKRIVVKVVRLQDFHPSKATLEKGDIETVVGEFRKFLEAAVDGDGAGQSTILEIR